MNQHAAATTDYTDRQILPAAPLPVRTELECYQIREILGQGGGGISYRAYDSHLQREVVLKEHFPQGLCYRQAGRAELTPTEQEPYRHSLEVFLREAQVLAGIKHEGIISVHEVFHACNTAYIVLEYAEGYTLLQRAQQAPFSSAELRHLLRRLLHTLSYLHGLGILHRDIKPSNIILQEENSPVLIDFGAALTEIPEHTITSVGSQAFSAPEQFNNHRKLGPWSDLYALGNTILYLMTDEAANDTALLQTLRKAVEYRPEDRWQSAEEWLAALEAAPLAPAAAPAPRKRRLRPWLIAAGMCAAAAAGAFGLFSRPEPQTPPPSSTATAPAPAATTLPTPDEEQNTPTEEDAAEPVEDAAEPVEDTAEPVADTAEPEADTAEPAQQQELYEQELANKTNGLDATYQLKRIEIAGKEMSGAITPAQKNTELLEAHRHYVEEYNAISRELAAKYGLTPALKQ